ncbi:MAG: hypothetical protein K0Q59_1296, partial [Paenibacillus sp.]|nr:hypothetical protein [Paenibacillus sp.]
LDRMEMETSDSGAERIDRLAGLFELAIVGESRNRIEYHVYDRDKEWVAEVFVRLSGSDVMAEVDWKAAPSDEESEAIADLLVSDFDPEEIDTFWIEMIVDGEVVETIELTHEDLLDDDEAHLYSKGFAVRLVRNDGDTLTYELFDKERGEVPIGQATIDLGSDDMTGFIDFSDSFSSEDRELIGSLLSMELDKERDYDSLNLTMLHNNVPIDEIWFESETFH